MRNKLSMITVVLCWVAFTAGGCKKKNDAGAGGGSAGGGSAAMGGGSADPGSAGSAAMGSGSGDMGGGSSMTAGSGSAAAAGTGAASCSATAYKSPAGAFCIEAPKDWKVTETKDEREVTVVFEDEKTMHSFAVTVQEDENNLHYDTMAEAFDARAKDPANAMSAAEFGGGVTGKIQVYTAKGSTYPVQIFAIVKGNKHFYNCGGENMSPEDVPVVPTACKTLRPTD